MNFVVIISAFTVVISAITGLGGLYFIKKKSEPEAENLATQASKAAVEAMKMSMDTLSAQVSDMGGQIQEMLVNAEKQEEKLESAQRMIHERDQEIVEATRKIDTLTVHVKYLQGLLSQSNIKYIEYSATH